MEIRLKSFAMMYEEAENKRTIKEKLAIAEPEAPQELQENKET